MSISEMLLKSSPVSRKRETSQSEYNKLVDANAKLIDKIKYQEKQIERLKANEEFFCKCITKAMEYMKNYIKVEPEKCTTSAVKSEFEEVMKILQYGGIDKE